jgi:hypothetical protein
MTRGSKKINESRRPSSGLPFRVRRDAMHQKISIPSCLLIMLFAGALHSEEIERHVADQPKYLVGDSWTFKRTSTNVAKGEDRWRRTVAALPSDGRVQMRQGNGTLYLTDAALNPVADDPEVGYVLFVQYPLRIANRTTFSLHFTDPNEGYYGSSEVEGYEPVSVPAGTFQCFRVSTKATYSWSTSYKVYRTWRRWYCPDVKWFAKQEYEERTTASFNPASNAYKREVSELVSFSAGSR